MANGKPGAPSIRPDEPSIELRTSIEVSLHRRLRWLAQREREPVNDLIRDALRAFVAEKLTVLGPPS